MTEAPDRLADELVVARDEFLAALAAIEPARLADPGLHGTWSARELIAHLGYWVGHAADAIHAAEEGWADAFEVADAATDGRNETVARIARQTDLETVRRREAASFDALLERLRGLDPALLDIRLADWGSLHDGVREDGANHYRAHATDLRSEVEAP